MNTINNTPSFGGATNIFQHRIIKKPDNFDLVESVLETPYVGTLPKEIIKDIVQLHTSPETKKAAIMSIMDAFSQTASKIGKKLDANGETIFSKIWDFIKKLFATLTHQKPRKLKYCPELSAQKKEAIGASQEKILTTAFKSVGLINNKENISIRFLGDGTYKNVYLIEFPERTGYKSKVMGIYKGDDTIEINPNITEDNDPARYASGLLPELNIMSYLNKVAGKKSPFVQGHFGSIKDRFILCDYALNRTAGKANSDIYKYPQFNIVHCDLRDENIINGWIIDYGGVVMTKPSVTKPTT